MTDQISPPTGKIILLNGSSSAGKTTLALKIQQLSDEPFHHMALDQFRDGLAGKYRGLNSPATDQGSRGLNVVPIKKDGAWVTDVQFGDLGERTLKGMRRAIAAFATAGNNVVVDDLLFKPSYLYDYLKVLADYDVWFIGIRCSLEVVNQREAQRPGRFPGTATSHFDVVHSHGVPYDLEVDTAINTPRVCAQQILKRLTSAPQTFNQHYQENA